MKCILQLITLFLIFAFWGCNKDDDGGGDTLPPATQTGANTFGCYINGKPFIHKDGPLQCNYQYVDGTYYFGVSGKKFDNLPGSIGVGALHQIQEGETYSIVEEEVGNACASAFYQNLLATVKTDQEYSGELKITRLDQINLIVSGTFWFDYKDPITGQRVQVRDGRFDAVYIP